MENEERIKYLSKKYFDRTITREEWEEVLWRLGRAEVPENIDNLFRDEWLRENQIHRIPHVTWEIMQSRWNSDQNQGTQRTFISRWMWAAAASILVLISAVWWVWGQEKNLLAYETGFGETEEILLDDGTVITLNANSRLVWDMEWAKSGIRMVELDGEAYFDVSHKETTKNGSEELLPFKVQTPDLVVNVLGTAFNVSNRRGETDVFLERGLVKLILEEGINDENNLSLEEQGNEILKNISNSEVLMEPGDHVSYSKETNLLKKEAEKTNINYPTWKNGAYSFRKMEFGKILTQLEDLYGKRFEVKDRALLSREVTLSFPYENWETVYKLIEITLNLEIVEDAENNIVTIRNRAR